MGFYRYRIKRVLDITGALLGLILFSPVLVLGAILVKLDSTNGPVLADTPPRVGYKGQQFAMHKFRTMDPDAHERIRNDPQMRFIREKQKKNGGKLRIAEDPRITLPGRLLRILDIDELPQLLNVLAGEMSLVGPRPYYEEELKEFAQNTTYAKEKIDKIQEIRPGITGLWQVSGRNDLSFEKRIDLDCEYASEVSFWKDVRILLKTPYVVLLRIGAW